METNGMLVTAFKSGLEVPNFPVRKMDPVESQLCERIKFARRLELSEQIWCRSQGRHVVDAGPNLTAGCAYIVNVNARTLFFF